MGTPLQNEREALRRDFYNRLSPQLGPIIAMTMAPNLPASEDTTEAEMHASANTWLKANASGALEYLKEMAWWMTRFQDRTGRLSKDEVDARHEELTSFGVAALGVLMDRGILQWKKEPTIPVIQKANHDPVQDEITKAVLERMEASLKEDHDE